MSTPEYSPKALTAARLAWNELSNLLDEAPEPHESDETFDAFFSLLIAKLFEEDDPDNA